MYCGIGTTIAIPIYKVLPYLVILVRFHAYLIIFTVLVSLIYTSHVSTIHSGHSTCTILPFPFFLRTDVVWSGLWSDEMNVTGQVSYHTVMTTFPYSLTSLSPLQCNPFFAQSFKAGGKLRLCVHSVPVP